MSVIIRLQNLPWSANALDIRNFFRGLSIPEGGVHIVGGELGDAFIAFSTDEDARQAMMLDCGKIKEIQVKLLLSSRSEMHKVIETARQSVPILSLAPTAPTPAPAASPVITPAPIQAPAPVVLPVITPFSTALGTNSLSGFGIPGLGNPQEIPQPAVIEPPAPLVSPSAINTKEDWEEDKDEEKTDRRRSREKDRRRTRSRSRSRDRERKERKRDRRDRSRSRERRRRDRSRSRDRRERKRDRKERSRSRDRSPSRRSRDRRNERRSPGNSQEKIIENTPGDTPSAPALPSFGNNVNAGPAIQLPSGLPNGPNKAHSDPIVPRFNDPTIADAYNKLQELGKKRNPNAFQGDNTNGVSKTPGRVDSARAGNHVGVFRREGRSRFDNDQQAGCCIAIRNAPNHTSYGDVRRFLPFYIDKHGIKMINDNMGRRTGNIYVRFYDSRSKNLALQHKLNDLKGAQVIVEHLDDESYETAVDSFLPFREDNDEEDVSLVIADTENNALEPFSVIKLTELPHFVKEHDIIKAFSDYSLLSIMLMDCRISRSKIAFVQFAKPEEAKLAFQAKDSYMFGRRQPTLTTVTNEEFEKEKNKNEKPTDMPRITEKDTEASAVPRDPRQRRPQFDTPSVQKTPLVATPPQTGPFFSAPFVQQQGFPSAGFNAPSQFGGYPPVTGSIDPRTAAANWANRPQFPNPQNLFEKSNSPGIGKRVLTTEMDEEPLDCVLMKGLPREATDRTIVTFLSDTGAVPARIHLMLDTNGLPSGDCFCEFRSSQEARMAATKHGNNLDGCRITVDLVPRTVVEEALEGPKQPDSLLNTGPPQQYFEPARGGFGPRGPYRGRGSYDRGGFIRGGFEMGRGGYRGRGVYGERGGFSERGRGIGFDRGRGRGRGFAHVRGFENGRDEEHDPALADFGAPGCVVSMENVPFRATIEEIMQFFSEFELTHDDVIRRYNERGQPTGDARVAFRTLFDAQRAVKSRHMDTIHERRISLNII